MYSALNTFSEYTYFYILKNITSNTSIASFKNYQKSSVCPQPKSLRKTHKKNGTEDRSKLESVLNILQFKQIREKPSFSYLLYDMIEI